MFTNAQIFSDLEVMLNLFGGAVEDQTKEPWFQLRQLATVEPDPAKRLTLMTEIDRLLGQSEQRPKGQSKWRDTRMKQDGASDNCQG